jgi:hypothetical protein
MSEPADTKPACFADLEKVLPFEPESGLRGPNRDCLGCPALPQCLREAVQTPQGQKVRYERLEETSGRGLLGRLRMWHERKLLEQQKK